MLISQIIFSQTNSFTNLSFRFSNFMLSKTSQTSKHRFVNNLVLAKILLNSSF
ncbi:hypothetical protein HanRHA438_Chr16g0746441 [Helianthus annuus]|nr:hypothetical protein HanRHA438_Chr16g0746441 [Helianthus annuus]